MRIPSRSARFASSGAQRETRSRRPTVRDCPATPRLLREHWAAPTDPGSTAPRSRAAVPSTWDGSLFVAMTPDDAGADQGCVSAQRCQSEFDFVGGHETAVAADIFLNFRQKQVRAVQYAAAQNDQFWDK